MKLSFLSIIVGLVLIFYAGILLYLRYKPNRLSFESYTNESVSHDTTSTPSHLSIPHLNISVPITSAEITNSVWATSSDSISYLSSSPQPGQKGNSILYGHNWKSLLGNLYKIKPGEVINISYADGSVKTFTAEFISTVKPHNTEILNPSDDSRITLYTCSGFLDSNRFVVVAKLSS